MNPKEEGDSISPPKSPVFDKGKAPIAFGFSEPFSSHGSFLEDTAVGLAMVSIGFSASLTVEGFSTVNPISSSAPHLFDFKIEPGIDDSLDPIGTSSTGSGAGMMATSSDMAKMDVPRPLECLQGQLVPPFLWKTFDLVEDPALDPILSWGSTGQSFVVWDPVEFSRAVLPSNFKHNNFSSFVRQLNTYVGIAVTQRVLAAVGFRKIDTDKWEFANESFQRGKRHLLKNIQRRKSPHSQQITSLIGPSAEAGKSGLEDEIGRLKRERSMLMQEVVELQQQQKGTAQHVDMVSRRLQSAEQKQKQMISFLAKLLQNPAFLAHLRKKKEQKDIDSPRVKRKFLKQHQHEIDELIPSAEGQIVKYRPDRDNLTISSTERNLNPDLLKGSSGYHLQGISGELGSAAETMSFEFGNASSSNVIVSDELALHHGNIKAAEELRIEASNTTSDNQHLNGRTIRIPSQEFNPDCFLSLAEDFPQFSPSGIDHVIQAEEIWSSALNVNPIVSSSSNELWSNPVSYEDPLSQVTSGLPPIWDLDYLQAGGSGDNKWSADDFLFDESDS